MCNTPFRVHTNVLAFHSPVLSQIFAKGDRCSERNGVQDFTTFSSFLSITTKYEISAVRSQILDVTRDAYVEPFGKPAPSKPLGESILSGRTPRLNAVLNLFVQQNLTFTLLMAYCMTVQRGLDSLVDRHLSASARLTPEILQLAIGTRGTP